MVNTNFAHGPRRSTFEAQDTYTRLANTTQYTAGDAISDHATTPTVLDFSVGKIKGAGGKINNVVITKTNTTLTSAAWHLYLFDTTIAVAGIKDNLVDAITAAEWLTCIGFLEILEADWEANATTAIWNKSNLDIPFVPGVSTTSIFGALIADATYTPASGEVISVMLSGEQD